METTEDRMNQVTATDDQRGKHIQIDEIQFTFNMK